MCATSAAMIINISNVVFTVGLTPVDRRTSLWPENPDRVHTTLQRFEDAKDLILNNIADRRTSLWSISSTIYYAIKPDIPTHTLGHGALCQLKLVEDFFHHCSNTRKCFNQGLNIIQSWTRSRLMREALRRHSTSTERLRAWTMVEGASGANDRETPYNS